ncbi:unnamed protein product [Candidula unifasciata]|uniref:Uncharacterized protein n=1 Tax=Candidula unifasciata TaxID=100452 RepID=A0A8S4ACW7_9EUPU|nr:unnamed protein product [Candidula unifasciata]
MSVQVGTESNGCLKFKLVLLGDIGVGKTSIFMRVKDDVYHGDTASSIGIDTCSRQLTIDNKDIMISLWDTAGVERFRTLTRNFFRNTSAVLLVFSVDEPSTLSYLSKWEENVKEYAPTAQRFLIGNKVDKDQLVSQEAAQHFAAFHNCEFVFMTSAKTGQGISEVLSTVGQHLLSRHKKASYEKDNSWLEHSIYVNSGQHSQNGSTSCC